MGKTIADVILEDLKKQTRAGNTVISIDALESYLKTFQNAAPGDLTQAEIEQYKALKSLELEGYKYETSVGIEELKAAITAGQSAIRAILLINGGAAVAVLAFLGRLAGTDAERVSSFASCLVPFATGTLIGGLVAGATYLSQWFGSNWYKTAMGINIIAIILGILAYGAFGIGIAWTYDAFQRFGT